MAKQQNQASNLGSLVDALLVVLSPILLPLLVATLPFFVVVMVTLEMLGLRDGQ